MTDYNVVDFRAEEETPMDYELLLQEIANTRAMAMESVAKKLGLDFENQNPDDYYDLESVLIAPGKERITIMRVTRQKVGETIFEYKIATDTKGVDEDGRKKK